MVNFLRSWLSFSLLITLSLQRSAPLILRDAEPPKAFSKQLLVRRTRYRHFLLGRHARNIQINQKSSKLLATASQDGNTAFAEVIVDNDDDTSVISMEKFKYLLKSIHCANTSLAVSFKDHKSFAYTKRAWKWCGWNTHRLPLAVSEVRFDEHSTTANSRLDDQIGKTYSIPWSSQWEKRVSLLLVMPSLSHCRAIAVELREASNLAATFTLIFHGVSARIGPKLTLSGDFTDRSSQEFDIAKVPIYGYSIPRILDLGPEVVFSPGFSEGPVSGSASVSSGIDIELMDSAELKIDLISPQVVHSWWTPQLRTEPMKVDAQNKAGVDFHAKAAIQLAAVAFGMYD
ncbi:hypothetical protein BDV23DRAFT_170747 [Aspergillus alliaceus]|uniref:Uncharacterized protein n=1 Tax=Petromyces alliaceus TaxID=209559 RepID=A0A5N7CFU3_PETAA|nr:hypothetical protein BDV23DRAFT_170747 [Aspergillus alliaceus]